MTTTNIDEMNEKYDIATINDKYLRQIGDSFYS